MDVTTRKLTEIELRRSKEHLADAQRLSRTGSVGMEVVPSGYSGPRKRPGFTDIHPGRNQRPI